MPRSQSTASLGHWTESVADCLGACALHNAERNKALFPLWSPGEYGEAEPQTDLEKRDGGTQLYSNHVVGWTTPLMSLHTDV